MLPNLSLIVSFDGDHIGRRVGRATLSDDIEEVRRVDQAINKGNEFFRSWALSTGGSIIEIGGDEGRLEIPADRMGELSAVMEAYASAVDATVSVGIGKKLSESAKALLAAKLRGGNRIVIYDESVEADIAKTKEQTEPEKISAAYLQKADAEAEGSAQAHHSGGVSAPHKSHPSRATTEHSEGEAVRSVAGQAGEPSSGPLQSLEDRLHTVAAATDKSDRAAAMSQSEDYGQLKETVAAALTQLKGQLPIINQLKQAYPDTHAAILGLVQSVVTLARGLQTEDVKLDKAENPTFGAIQPVGKRTDYRGTEVYDYSHLLPTAFRGRQYRLEVTSGPGDDEYKVRHKVLASFHDSDHHSNNRPNHGDRVGRVVGYVGHPILSGRSPNSIEPHSYIFDDKKYRRKGIGSALYEAVYAHAKNTHGADEVVGGEHSFAARGVHEKLAKKYGFKISGGDKIDDDSAGAYHYPLARNDEAWEVDDGIDESNMPPVHFSGGEELSKAIGEIKPSGSENRQDDYTHILPPEFRNNYRLKVQTKLNPALRERVMSVSFDHKDSKSQKPLGKMTGYIVGKHGHAVEPHSELDKTYHGKGIGVAMYESLFAHAKNRHSISRVEGPQHTTAAHKVHERLAAKHGFTIVGAGATNDEEIPHDSYHYNYKTELSDAGLDESRLEPLYFREETALKKEALNSHTAHHRTALPVGTQLNGKVKVRHADGNAGWKGVRAGMIQGQEAGAPLFGANSHPVSSREPSSK